MITPLTEMMAVVTLRLTNVMMNITAAEAAKPYIPQRFHFQMAMTHTRLMRLKSPIHGRVHLG